MTELVKKVTVKYLYLIITLMKSLNKYLNTSTIGHLQSESSSWVCTYIVYT